MDTIFILNSHKQVIDVLSNNGSNPSAPFFDDTYKSELDTGAESYEFTTINNLRTNVTLEVGNYVLFKYNDKYKLFQIMETEDEHSEGKKLLTVYAEMAGMELLNDYCEPFSIEGNFIALLERALQDTNWRVGTYSASLLDNIQSVSYTEPKNVYSIIQENLATFGGVEIEFRVEFRNNQLAALLIDCYESGTRGNRKYRRFEYGKDVKGLTRNRNINDLATAVIGQGNNNVTFKDIEWDKNLGNPCDKPLQQDFVVDIEANDLWNNGGKYIKTVHKVDTDDPQTLLQECWDYLQEIKQPKFDYDVDLALVAEDYQDIGIGDTNYVLDFDYQPAILLEARVGTLELSFADPRDNKCVLTNYKELTSILQQPVDLNTVGNMIQSKFPIQGEDIAMGAIGEGHINVTYYQAIKTDILSAAVAEVGTLIADKADITDLTALNADIENLRATKAEITDLNATNGNITNLTSQVGQIETIINGHFTGTDAQVLNITAQNTTFDNAVIKDAMIDTVSANKMNTGTLNTNNVNIESEDGGIKISGATQQFKDKEGHVRVQIGKDAQGNFTFCLFSQDGVGILLDETGIKAGAVPNGLIVNDMVADNANISGNKIDIASVITNINNNTTSIKSSAIKFDDTGQTLQVAFNELKTKVNTIEEVTIQGDLSSVIEQVNTNTTNIGVMQGQISSLITNTTITKENGQVVQLKDDYSTTKQTVNEISAKMGSLETNYKKTLKISSVQYYLSTSLTELAGGSWQDTAPAWTQGKYMWQRMKYTYTDGSTTYGTASCVAGAKGDTGKQGPQGIQGEQGIQGVKGDTGAKGPQGEKGDKGDTGLQGPQGSKGDTGSQGPKGDKGATGEKGQSLTSSTPQWYLSTSNTTQTGGNWQDTMPTITTGRYIWQRFKNVWANPTATTYTTPVLEQIAESIKEVTSKQAEYKQTLDEVSSTLTQTTTTANEAKTQASTNKQSIDSMSTTLTQTTNTANNALNKATKAQQNLDGFKTTVSNTYTTKTDFNNLSIGGRNLLKDSKTLTKTGGTGTDASTKWIVQNTGSEGFKKLYINTTSTNWIECHIPLYSPINSLTQNLTISFEYQESTAGLLVFNFAVFKADGVRIKELTNWVVSSDFKLLDKPDWKRVSLTFNPSAVNKQTDATEYRVQFKKVSEKTGSIQVRKFKLEIGDKATDWSPAPEDVDNKFKNYSTTKEMNSAIDQKADSITSTVSKTYTTKTDFNNLSIGGRNLVKNSNFANGIANWKVIGASAMVSVDSSFKFNGHNTLKVAVTGQTSDKWTGALANRITDLKLGDIFTISCWYYVGDKSTFDSTLTLELKGKKVGASGENNVTAVTLKPSDIVQGKWTRMVSTTKLTSDWEYMFAYPWVRRNGTAWFADIKLEKGNKVTDWTPAPEDADDTYATKLALSEVKQTADSITSKVEKDYATKSLVTQTANYIKYSFTHSGVPNLLYNGNFVSGFDCWGVSGGNWGRDSNLERTYIVWCSPGIGNTNYLIQTVPMNRYVECITCSCKMFVTSEGSDGTTNPFRNLYLQIRKANGETIYLEKGVTNFDTWETVSITCGVNANVTQIEVFCYTRDTTKYTNFAEVMLTEGDVVHEFSQAKCEMNYNSTIINTNGVTVYFDGDRGQGSSNLNYDGLTIYDSNGNKKAWFGNANSAYIDQISTNRLNEPSVLKCASLRGCPDTIYVNPSATGDGSGRDRNNFANSITSALNYFRETYGNCHYAQDLRVYVCNGEYWQDAFISGWLGSGMLEIYLEPNVIWHGKFTVEECHKIVHIKTDREWGSNSGAIIYHDNPFHVRASNIQITGFRASSSSEHTGTFLEAFNCPNVVAETCDIVNYHNVLGGWYSRFHMADMRGAVTSLAWNFYSNDLIWYASCPVIKNKAFNSTWNSRVSGVSTDGSGVNSVWQPWTPEYVPPAQPTENWVQVEQTFWATDLHTTPEGNGSGTTARSGCWGQGSWSSYKAHRGHASFDGVGSWCSGGRNFSVYITMHRLNTKHGQYGAVPVPKFVQTNGSSWSCGQAFALDNTYTIALPWSVTSNLVNGNTNELQLWAGKSTNDYSFYDNVSIRIVCEKNMV